MEACARYLAAETSPTDHNPQQKQQWHTALTLATAQQLSATLEEKLNQRRHNLRNAINNNRQTYTDAVQQADNAQTSISELLGGVDSLQTLLGDNDSGIHAQLATARRNEMLVNEQLQASSAVLGCLRQLSELYADLRSMDAAVRAGDLLTAARLLGNVQMAMQGADIQATKIEEILGRRTDLAKLDIRDKVVARLKRAIKIHKETDSGGLCIAVDDDGKDAKQSVEAMMAAADQLGAIGQVQSEFGAYFVASFVHPVLAAASVSLDSHDNCTYSATLGQSDQAADAAGTCDAIVGAMRFIGAASGQTRLWERACAQEICELVAQRLVCSGNRLPSSRRELDAFAANQSTLALLSFEDSLFAMCPAEADSDALASQPIRQAVGRIAALYTEHRCDQALAHARVLAEDTGFAVHDMDQHELWNADLVHAFVAGSGAQDTDRLSELIRELGNDKESRQTVFPQCTISRSVHELVQLAYSLANEALLATGDDAGLWVQAARNALDSYCALFPLLHGPELHRVPALGWLFFNDCMYAAHHSALLKRLVPQLPDSPALAFLAAGSNQRRLLMQRQADELSLQARGPKDMFYAAANEQKQQALEKAAKQTQKTLEHLARGIRPPSTTPHVYYTTLGNCIDAAFEATVAGIIDVRDIGVDDSQVLSDHCRRILSIAALLLPLDQKVAQPYVSLGGAWSSDGLCGAAADRLLTDSGDDDEKDDSNAVQRLGDRYCAMKDKLAQLADILVISRADILARRRAGLLAQFSTDELVRLIRALFSDTSERARDIDALRAMA
ncbi:ribosome biogenesis protein ytm1 [Coemansia sp. IMI 203386]|nr:ribosome biogenesis protein ytm1 [Coemansia sp. IMI 203386]